MTKELTKLQRLTLVSEAFTPGGPVDTYSLFVGRTDKIQDVVGAVYFAIQTAVGGFVWQIRDSGNHEILASSEILRTRWDRNTKKWVAF